MALAPRGWGEALVHDRLPRIGVDAVIKEQNREDLSLEDGAEVVSLIQNTRRKAHFHS